MNSKGSCDATTDTTETSQDQRKDLQNPPQAKIIKDINEFIIACQRTKYQEAVLFHKRGIHAPSPTHEKQEKRLRTQSSRSRTWTEILEDLYEVMPLISDEQYALISRLVSLCLLAYLMPQTCNFAREDAMDITCPRNGKHMEAEKGEKASRIDKGHGLREMESILDNSPQIRHLPSSQFDPCKAHDERISSSFWDFLHSGLGPFLSSRPMSRSLSTGSRDTEPNCGCADLLHVLSMAISADLTDLDQNENIGSDDNGVEVTFSMPNRVRCLIMKRQSEYFQISALQRAKIVHVVANNLVLPKFYVPQDNGSLLMGGVLHLRASLRSFSMFALSSRQLVDAKKGLLRSAVDTECFAYFEMKALVKNLASNKSKRTGNHCNCRSRNDAARPRSRELKAQNERFVYCTDRNQAGGSTYRQQIMYRQSINKDVCVHCSNGDLLCDLILRYNGSRHYADGVFTGQTLAELTCAIATLLSQIDSTDQKEQIHYSSLPTACTIASLLDAARALFYFLLSPSEDKNSNDSEARGAQELENGMKDALLECVIQLLGSHDRCIAISSSSLLALAAAYENQARIENVVGKIFITLKRALRNSATGTYDDYRDIIEVMSKRSSQFAASMILYIIELLESKHLEGEASNVGCLRTLFVISSQQPRVMYQQLDRLNAAISTVKFQEDVTKQFSAIYVVCSGLIYTNTTDVKLLEGVEKTLTSVSNPWSVFQLARLALTTANFQVASIIFGDRLSTSLSSPSSFLWVSSLAAVARAEQLLSQEGCSGINTALIHLDTALSKVRSMAQDTSFQIELLSLRKDFLQICLVLSNLCQEMRLTNVIGSRSTRNHLHQQNASRCFYMLGSRYHRLFKRYGMYSCQHTQSSVRSQFSLCRFLGDVIRLYFSGSQKHSKSLLNLQDSLNLPQGDAGRVHIQIIQKLRSELINSFENSLEPSIRGEILHQIVNTILKCPNPYPKCFTVLRRVPKVKIQVAAKGYNGSDQTFTVISLDDDSPYKTSFVSPLHLRLSGSLPGTLFTKLNVPFSQIFAHVSFSLGGPLQRDIDAEDPGRNTEKGNEVEDINVTASSNLLPSDSRFIIDCECPAFQKEGYYHLTVKLLARDIRCGEYEINTNLSDERLVIRASSSQN